MWEGTSGRESALFASSRVEMLTGSVVLIVSLVLLSLVINIGILGSEPRIPIIIGTLPYLPIGVVPLWLIRRGQVTEAAWFFKVSTSPSTRERSPALLDRTGLARARCFASSVGF